MKSKKITKITLGFFLLFAFIFSTTKVNAETTTDWTRYQNSETNNGVTDRPGPTDAAHTVALWNADMGFSATTPPLIVNDKIYTASGNFVYCFDKTTGKKLGQSDLLKGYVGHALHPMVYAEGKLFVITSTTGTMIEALDLKDPANPKRLWSSDVYAGTSYSPLSYHYNESKQKGYLYTGTYNGDNKGVYFCVSATDGNKVWSFEDDNGFYWAGAYATDQYVAFASENAIGGDDKADGSTLYTVDAVTGVEIDKITGLKGSIRNTVVYDKGSLYIGTVAGRLYRIKVENNGDLGDYSSTSSENFSYIDLGGRIKATVLVHNNRIYVGLEGENTGTSCYKVVDWSDTNKSMSVFGSVKVGDEPKGAPILSTAENGTRYIYFTCNQTNGGIYYFTDNGQSLSQSQLLFEPASSQQEKCISPLALDTDGTIYYTNDSKYLMAVGPKIIKDVEITSASGEIKWDDQRFVPDVRTYNLTATDKVSSLQFNVKKLDQENAEVSYKFIVNGTDQGTSQTVSLDGETTNVELRVVRGAITLSYKFRIKKVTAQNTSLSLLYYGQNFYSGGNLLPEIEEGKTEYSVDLRKTTSVQNPYLWILPLHSGAETRVYAVENVKRELSDQALQSGKELIPIYTEQNGELKYEVNPVDSTKNTVIRVCITSADGSKTQDYQVKFIRTDEQQNVTPPPSTEVVPPTTEPIQPSTPQVITPSKTTITGISNSSKGITLTWKKAENAKTYLIYRRTNSKGSYKKVKTTSAVSWTDTSVKNGTSYQYKIISVNGTKKSSASSAKALYRLSVSSFTKVQNQSGKKLKLTWKKNSKATGYQIQYSTNKKFSKAKTVTVKKAKTTSQTLKKLTKKKTYYVRIRSYKKISGKNIYSSWSKTVSKKITK